MKWKINVRVYGAEKTGATGFSASGFRGCWYC